MSWLTKITAVTKSAADALGDSAAYLKKKTGVTVTDRQADAATVKITAAMAKVEGLLVDVIDELPGVPRPLAKLAVGLIINLLEGAIATAADNVKAKN